MAAAGGGGGGPCSYLWVSRGEWQAATAARACVSGAVEVKWMAATETLAGIRGQAEENSRRRRRPMPASMGQQRRAVGGDGGPCSRPWGSRVGADGGD